MALANIREYSLTNAPPASAINPFPGSIEITDKEFELFRSLIYDKSGINLNPTKKGLLHTRLLKRLSLHNCATFAEYYYYIQNDDSGEELIAMLNAVSTNLTKFFREENHFLFLQNTVLPEITQGRRKSGQRRLRVWCAGCSSGEEPYSIGITLLQHIESPLLWDIKILATDISTDILEKAAEGIYEKEKVSELPHDLLSAFFIRGSSQYSGYYKVKSALQNIISFRRLNLIDEKYPFRGKFDFIFCRNVMIYFDKRTQERIVNRYYNCLEDGGYLFIGHSESLNGVKSPFTYVMPAVYRKERT